jgi:hypothetical protein
MKHHYIVAWTTSSAEAPMVEVVEMTDQEADKIERLLSKAEMFPTVQRLDSVESLGPADFRELRQVAGV